MVAPKPIGSPASSADPFLPLRRRRSVDVTAPAALSSRAGRLAAALFVAGALTAGLSNAATERARIGSGDFAALVDQEQLLLEALPLPGEGLTAFCRRLTGTAANAPQIAALNGRPRRLQAGRRYRLPYDRLAADRQFAVIMALFPRDRVEGDFWLHLSL